MKLDKRLLVDGETRALSSEQLIFELSAGGRATFVVEGDVTVHQIIEFHIGYQGDYKRYFDGFVTRAQKAANGYTRVIARERSGILASRWPLSIQHPTLSEVIEQLSFDTGLSFVLPENASYVTTRIPNFTSQGTGYQLLENAGRAFSIDDFCWYQQTNGSIFVGSYADSRWPTRAVTLPEAFSQSQLGGNSMKLAVMPSVRPGAIINGNRVTKVTFEQTEMTLYWHKGEFNEKRKIHYLFPELAAGHHLPRFGRVEAVTDSARSGHENNPFRPRYAVDVQLLDENGDPDTLVPIYKAVPLPVMVGGAEQGMLATPTEGTIVEIAFAYGRSDKPFIRTILGHGWSLPDIEPQEQLQQQRNEVFTRTDAAGNHTQNTDQKRISQAFEELQQADRYIGEFGSYQLRVSQHSIETITGKKQIEALGAIELLAGDNLELGSLANTHFATAGELVAVIGALRSIIIAQDDKLNILGNRLETIEKDWEATAKNMRFTADLITMNGGKGVVQGDCICAFTGLPHSDLSSTVKAGK